MTDWRREETRRDPEPGFTGATRRQLAASPTHDRLLGRRPLERMSKADHLRLELKEAR